MKRFIKSAAALLLALVMLSSCAFVNAVQNAEPVIPDSLLSTVGKLLERYSYYEVDGEILAKMLVEDYRRLTGDKYAIYYNAAEYAALVEADVGKMHGIGLSFSENTALGGINIDDIESGSPADDTELRPGDVIISVGIGEAAQSVASLGYEESVKLLRGEEGTFCEFTIARGGDISDTAEFSVERRAYTAKSVLYAVSAADSKVGIVKVREFNYTTPTAFTEAMDTLLGFGCDKFVFDMRGNPGGALTSVAAILSYFLNEGDAIVHERGRGESEEQMLTTYCRKVSYTGNLSGCSVSSSDIGKYRGYSCAVLTNAKTASAAELFTCAMKDYGLAISVGQNTFGKGCMQGVYPMAMFGDYPGALRLTTKYYYPPLSDNYHEVGIAPDEGYEVVLDEAAVGLSLSELLGEKQSLDNQLAAAIEYLNIK